MTKDNNIICLEKDGEKIEYELGYSADKLYDLLWNFLNPVYNAADEAHGWSHILDVTITALKINKELNLGLREEVIVAAGMIHDMYSYTDRDDHHTKAAEFVRTDFKQNIKGYGIDLSLQEVEDIANAVAEHRASYKGEYSSVLSELIATADRGEPCIYTILKRVMICSLDKGCVFAQEKTGISDLILPHYINIYGVSTNRLKEVAEILKENDFSDSVVKTYVHIYEKYSRIGYAKNGTMYKTYYKDKLAANYDIIDKLVTDVQVYISTYNLIKDDAMSKKEILKLLLG